VKVLIVCTIFASILWQITIDSTFKNALIIYLTVVRYSYSLTESRYLPVLRSHLRLGVLTIDCMIIGTVNNFASLELMDSLLFFPFYFMAFTFTYIYIHCLCHPPPLPGRTCSALFDFVEEKTKEVIRRTYCSCDLR
jgi:hypothetical protein